MPDAEGEATLQPAPKTTRELPIMATMYPPRFPSGSPTSERNVYEALQGLDDDWLVFHSVGWQGARHGRQGDGEADFVIAHPRKGVIVVEVKGGNIEIRDGRWFSIDRSGSPHEIRNPFEQAVDSKYALRDHLDEHVPRLKHPPRMGHVVAFPAVEITRGLSTKAPRSIIWDRYDLKDIERAANRVSSHWEDHTQFDDQQFAALRKALAPTTQIRKRLRHRVEEINDDLVDLTDQQTQLLGFLRRQRRAFITGGAGTGKTELAIERSRQLADEGRDVLLLCYSELLGEKFAAELSDLERVTAGSFHRVVHQIVEQAGRLPDGERDENWWNVLLPRELPDAASELGVEFDAAVVDEGHDFHPMWWTALGLLIPDPQEAFLYVFADSHKELYRDDWIQPFPADPFELDVRCRNTNQISERVRAVLSTPGPSLGTQGPPPGFIPAEGIEGFRAALQRVIGKLLNEENFRSGQITVLSIEPEPVEALRGETIEGHELTSHLDDDGITIETVDRFRGLESDVVILLVDEADSETARARAYVGMSRGRVLLLMAGPTSAKTALGWG